MSDTNSIQEIANIIDSATNWNTRLIKEALHIELKKSVLETWFESIERASIV